MTAAELAWLFVLLNFSAGLTREFIWECEQNPCNSGLCFGHTQSVMSPSSQRCPESYMLLENIDSDHSYKKCFVLLDYGGSAPCYSTDNKTNNFINSKDSFGCSSTCTESGSRTTAPNTQGTLEPAHRLLQAVTPNDAAVLCGKNKSEAVLGCQNMGGDLFSIHTEKDITGFIQFLQTFYPALSTKVEGYWLNDAPFGSYIQWQSYDRVKSCVSVKHPVQKLLEVSTVDCSDTNYLAVCVANASNRTLPDFYQYMCQCPSGLGYDNCTEVKDDGGSAGKTWCINATSLNGTINAEGTGMVIQLDYAAFGNPGGNYCNPNDASKEKCIAENTLAVMAYWCQGKSSCNFSLTYLEETATYACPPGIQAVLEFRFHSVTSPLHCSPEALLLENDSTCYKLTSKSSWGNARQQCWEYGGDLAHFLDPHITTSFINTTIQLWTTGVQSSDDVVVWIISQHVEEEQRPVRSFYDQRIQPGTCMFVNNQLWTDACVKSDSCVSVHHDSEHEKSERHGLCALPPFHTPRPTLPLMPVTTVPSTSGVVTTEQLPTTPATAVDLCPSWTDHEYEDFTWNVTQPGHTVTQVCPDGASGTATWTCGQDGVWETPYPDMSQCSAINMNTWILLLNDSSDTQEIVCNLTSEVSETSLQSGDLSQLVTFLQLALTAFHKDLNSFQDVAMKEEHAKNYTESAVTLADHMLQYHSKWQGIPNVERKQKITELQQNLVQVGFILSEQMNHDNKTYRKDNVELQIDKMPADYYSTHSASHRYSNSEITLPAGFVSRVNNSDNVSLVFSAYSSLGCIISYSPLCHEEPSAVEKQTMVNSAILGASVGSTNFSISSGLPVVIRFSHLYRKPRYSISFPLCVYWDEDLHLWSNESCYIRNTTSSYTECLCEHLTNFAVLMDVYGTLQEDEITALLITSVTIIGGTISLMCLALAIAAFTVVPSLRDERNAIHCNLCISLWMSEFILLVGLDATSAPIGCAMVAVLLHYFFLAAFSWMLIEGVNIYLMLVKVFNRGSSQLGKYYLAGYGVPFVIVVISLASTQGDGYGTDAYCWLSSKNGLIWAFVAPVALVALVNTGFLILALRISQRALVARGRATVEQAKSWLKGSTSLICLLGITWIFGFMYVAEGLEVFAVIFAIFNSLQGAFIFGFHCLINKKNREEIIKYLQHKGGCKIPVPRRVRPAREVITVSTGISSRSGQSSPGADAADNVEKDTVPEVAALTREPVTVVQPEARAADHSTAMKEKDIRITAWTQMWFQSKHTFQIRSSQDSVESQRQDSKFMATNVVILGQSEKSTSGC